MIENKKKYLPGYKFLIDDKAISEYMAAKLSSGGISVKTLQQVANGKGVNGLNAPPITIHMQENSFSTLSNAL